MKKKVLITGISRGIGKGICELLIENDYFIYGTYNTGQAQAEHLKGQYPNSLEVFKVDFSNRGETVKFTENLSDIQFDAIVHNAGVIHFQDFQDFDFSLWDSTFEVNLNTALILAVKLQHNILDGGAIVNIASTDGMTGTFSSMAYSASKAALINLTKSLGNNLGCRNIRVNAVAPGWVDTGMSTEESFEAASLTPMKRNGTPADIAKVVKFLISDEASFITGSTLIVDGGYTNADYIMIKEAEGEQN